MYGLEKVDSLMARLQKREESHENIDVDYVQDLNIDWHDQGPSVDRSGYYARINNRNMRLTDGAMKTACRLLKTEPKYFSQFEDRSEFPRALHKGIDQGRRRDKGVLLRHNGREVTAILPPDYVVKDAATLMDEFLEPLKENLGDIKGIYSLEQGFGDICSYRVVMGANLMPSLDDVHGQFMMFVLKTSETGQCPTKSTLGLYRTICTNSGIRQQTLSQWDHRIGYGEFYDSTAAVIQDTGYYQNAYAKIFGELLSNKLEVPGEDLVMAFSTNDLISRAHADFAKLYVNSPTEDGRECETQYDLFNALTRAARDLPSIEARELAESRTLKLFTDPGGIREQLRIAAESPRRRRRPGPITGFDEN